MSEPHGQAESIGVQGLAVQIRRSQPGPLPRLWTTIKRQPVGTLAALILLVMVLAGIFAGVVAPYDPTIQNAQAGLEPPALFGFFSGEAQEGTAHFLGTDALGRDVYSRLVYGARISLSVGVAAVLIGTIGGLLMGMISGYRGGRMDMVLQRVADSMQAIPTLILAMLFVAVLGQSLVITALAIGITQIPRANRVIRSNVLSVIQEPYVEAAKAMGACEGRIIFQHIMPNVMATTLIVFSTSIGAAIVTGATLSFLGLAAPPLATWGGMLSRQGRDYMMPAPWLVITPAIALSLTVLAFNFLGDSIRDVLDPRLRGR